MVRVQTPDNDATLDAIVKKLCATHDLTLYVEGWSRRSYRIYREEDTRSRKKELFASLDRMAIQSGVITYYADDALNFCLELGEALEREFGIEEAVLHRD